MLIQHGNREPIQKKRSQLPEEQYGTHKDLPTVHISLRTDMHTTGSSKSEEIFYRQF